MNISFFKRRSSAITYTFFLCVLIVLPSSALYAAPTSDLFVANAQMFERSEFLLAGSASDKRGIKSVTIALKNRADGRWLQANLGWGAVPHRHAVQLTFPGAANTTWLFREPLPIGTYIADVVATNKAGQTQSKSDRMTRQFNVVADRADVNLAKRLLTITFSRSMWGAAGGRNCLPYTDPVNGTVFLDEVADFLTSLGHVAQGSVPFGHIHPDARVRACPNKIAISASLQDMAKLRDKNGWTFVADTLGQMPSRPRDVRPPLKTLKCLDQVATASGSLAELLKNGHARGWGMIAAPNLGWTTAIRDNVTSRYFAFSRLYGPNVNTPASLLSGDWGYTRAGSGGRCNDPSSKCYKHYFSNREAPTKYVLPDTLLERMVGAPGTWKSIQFYRFVRGSNVPANYPGTAASPAGESGYTYWDCTSPKQSKHWTSRGEVYCYNDFVDVMKRIKRDYPDVVSTDAAHVATSLGIKNPNHSERIPNCVNQ